MDILKIVAINIKNYRYELNLSQESLAFKTGLHRTYISDIERGKRNVSLLNIQKLADSLEIDSYKLLIENKEVKYE